MNHSVQMLNGSPHFVGPSFQISRLLPQRSCASIGPFVFFDHFGPMPAVTSRVSTHPHAGIEVITYLLEGHIVHQDSLGNLGSISTGAMQYLLSGKGILHSEELGHPDFPILHGVQLWLRQPSAFDDAMPQYHTFDAQQIPSHSTPHYSVRLLAGTLRSLFSATGPLSCKAQATLAHFHLEPKGRCSLDASDLEEVGIAVLKGNVQLNEQAVLHDNQLLATHGCPFVLYNPLDEPCELLLLGGAKHVGTLHFCGNFVFDTQEACENAQRNFQDGLFDHPDIP